VERFTCKGFWLDIAEVTDSLRVFPRFQLIAYGYWLFRNTWHILNWFERLPADERTVPVVSLVTGTLTVIWGGAAWVYKVYADGGRDWDAASKGSGQ
jgi:hypothetical protein